MKFPNLGTDLSLFLDISSLLCPSLVCCLFHKYAKEPTQHGDEYYATSAAAVVVVT